MRQQAGSVSLFDEVEANQRSSILSVLSVLPERVHERNVIYTLAVVAAGRKLDLFRLIIR